MSRPFHCPFQVWEDLVLIPPRSDSHDGFLFHIIAFAVSRPENLVPECHGHAKVRSRNLMMNLVVGAELSVPGAFRIVVMMNVMEAIVEDESRQHARRESGNVAYLQPVSEDIPHAHVDACV